MPAAALIAALLAGGCAARPGIVREPPPAPPAQPAHHAHYAEAVIGFSAEGRPIRAHVFGRSGPAVIILGSIHGSEPAGAMLCDELVGQLRRAMPADRRVVVVPEANPDGLALRRRANARGVDLNRNFPAANFRPTAGGGPEPLSEPESRALYYLILAERPALVVTIHQPLAVVDYDGPAEELSHRLAAASGLPARRLGPRPGSLGSWVGEDLRIPIITLELPRSAQRAGGPAMWAAYGPAMLDALGWAEAAAK